MMLFTFLGDKPQQNIREIDQMDASFRVSARTGPANSGCGSLLR